MSNIMETQNTHDLTDTIGGCGKFQVILTLAVDATAVMAVFGMLTMTYGIYNPGWTCLDVDTSNTSDVYNLSGTQHDDMLSTASTIGLPSPSPSSDVDQRVKPMEWTVDCSAIKDCKHILYNDDSSTVVTAWDLFCDLAWVPSVLITVQMSGVMIGAYVSGQLGDKWGRKATLYGSTGVLVVSHLLAVFSVSWQMYAAILFIVGFGVGGVNTCCFYYPLEFVNGWWRGIVSAVPVWNIGGTAFALLVFIVQDWRNIHIAGTVLSGIVFMGVFWTPDSVRWLAVRGKTDQAKHAVAKIARMNGRPCPDTQIIDALAVEERSTMKGHKYTYVDLFRIRTVRGYTIKFGLLWFMMAISYYMISFGIKSLSGNFYLNFLIFGICELPGLLLVAPAVNRLGRRIAALVYFGVVVLCAMSLVIASLIATGSIKDTCIIVFALTCKMTIAGVWRIVSVLSSELYPTVVRSLHLGFLNATGPPGMMVSSFLIPNDPDTIYVAFVIIGALNVFSWYLVWSLPESQGRPLQDIAHNEINEVQPLNGIEEGVVKEGF